MHLLLDADHDFIECALKRVLHRVPLEVLDVVSVGNYKLKIHSQYYCKLLNIDKMARENFPVLTALIIGSLLEDKVTTSLSSSTIDLASIRLDSFNLLNNCLELCIDTSSGLIELHQDLKGANLELPLVNLRKMKKWHIIELLGITYVVKVERRSVRARTSISDLRSFLCNIVLNIFLSHVLTALTIGSLSCNNEEHLDVIFDFN